ncbi:hypothetical protein LU699_05035 [Luteimonas fraxinea]|uniref:NfeD-like C-terminal domain-containing protein n=1 Tax=Luteimonas fraxinea TaxID=2901869 RepID=A0ABS8U8X5_9GAMM|nr:hypothetical protein [Luteimonas fraxinea]MCD9095724.1 hypothetical protein [Luteimonas fraxinea]UHH11089.1 hypothetical protein LU699_05035 [Luteimonas fraxinea]
MRSKWLDAAVVLTLGTGLLYAGGHYYRQSYLATFGLSAEQFQKSGEALMFFGFHAGLTGGAKYLLWGIAVLYAGLVLLILWLVIGKMARIQIRWRARRIASIRASRQVPRKRHRSLKIPALNTLDRIATVLPAVSIAFGAVLLALAGAEKLGKSRAESVIANFDGVSRAALRLDNGASVRVGPLIVCDDSACAYLMQKGVLVLRRDHIVSASVTTR